MARQYMKALTLLPESSLYSILAVSNYPVEFRGCPFTINNLALWHASCFPVWKETMRGET